MNDLPEANDCNMVVSLIVALDDSGAIGYQDGLPWPKNSEDLKWFREITMGKVCIVGFHTNKTLPELPGRTVVMMPRGMTPEQMIKVWEGEELVVIGGAKTYRQWLPYIDRFYLSRIRGEYPADTYCKELAPWLKNEN